MQIFNQTAFAFGAHVCSRQPPRPEISVVMRATYRLVDPTTLERVEDMLEAGFLSGDTFAESDEAQLGELVTVDDFADFKPRAEVILRGMCHPPRPTKESHVEIGLGAWSKRIRVVGRRVWEQQRGRRVPSEPRPFEAMPLSWTRAFGGPGFAPNPIGIGHGEHPEVPNLELPDQPVTSPTDAVAPAGCGPVNPHWVARASKQGTRYDRGWQQKRAPFYAEDFNWTFFQAAPADQWLPSYPKGDETLRLVNVHPDHPTIEAPLPGRRPRAFVCDDEGSFRELTTALDTIRIEAEDGLVFLTWRAVGPVREIDLDDVEWLYLVDENLTEAPAPLDTYEAKLRAHMEDPSGVYASLPAWMVAASKGETVAPAEGRKVPSGIPEDSPGQALVEKLRRELVMLNEDELGQIEDGLAKAYDGAPQEKIDAQIEAILKAQADDDHPPPYGSRKPGSLGTTELLPAMRRLAEEGAKMRERAADPELHEDARQKLLSEADKIDEAVRDPSWLQLDPLYEPPLEPIPTDALGPGADLSERDLSGQDLRGIDLSGARLFGATLTKADLRGANLAGADLTRTVLYKADLSDANLRGCTLYQANAAKVVARGADLSGARLEESSFEGADLEGARLEEVTAAYVTFARGNLARANLSRGDFDAVDFEGADLRGCLASGARLTQAALIGVVGEGANLDGVDLTAASLEGADLRRASLRGAKGDGSYWLSAKLEGADLERARFQDAHFTKVEARGSRWFGADLKGARMQRIDLDEAVLDHARLFETDLCRATVNGTRFRHANLYLCKLLGVRGERTDFTGAATAHCVRDEVEEAR